MFDEQFFPPTSDSNSSLTWLARLRAMPWSGQFVGGLLLVVIGVLAVGFGLWRLTRDSQAIQVVEQGEPLSEKDGGSDQEPAQTIPKLVSIDIGGAVVAPGLYQVPENSRVGEVVASAGGITKQADQQYVHRELNLADQVEDGQKIYILTTQDRLLEEKLASTQESSEEPKQISLPKVSTSPLISINTASATSLEELEGIGSKRAEQIIAGRPYQKIEELVEKKIISQSVFNQISTNLTL